MTAIRMRILITCVVLLVAGVGGWQLLPSDEERTDPITVGTTDAVSSLDPSGAYDAGSWAMFSNVYQSLMTFKPGSTTPVPDAARSCSFVGMNLQTYRCELRDDLTFSNGNRLTAEDVKFSFDRMLGINADSGPQPLFPTLKKVDAEGLTVTFHLSARDATFPQKVATGAGSIVDHTRYPKDGLRTDNAVDGSGPYVLKEYKAGATARLEPNPRYKGAITKLGGPVVVRYFEESKDLAAAWKAGKVDVTHREIPPQTLAGLDRNEEGVNVTESDSAETRNLVFNMRDGSPMAEKAVRQAAAALIDRPKIATGAYHSTVEPLYSVIPQGFIGHNTAFYDEFPEPSADKARALLSEAGVETPVRITYAHRSGSIYAAEAAVLRKQLETDGLFEVKVVEAAWTDYQKGYAEGKYDAYTVGWLPDFPDSDNFAQPLVGRDNTLHNGYASTRVESLITATQQQSDRARTAQTFKDIQRQVAQDVPLVPLWQKKDYVLSTDDITGTQYLSEGSGMWRLWYLSWV